MGAMLASRSRASMIRGGFCPDYRIIINVLSWKILVDQVNNYHAHHFVLSVPPSVS
ncbi:hypothetical protein Pan54_25680 [Rubinisphaera italica]|uniref:Uncharacterized protein n=1 Tax=Rubinisphaera italica TaxID=2527969 RepID=A0A5C5XHH3_9PLAN|nr:hypothetical protein Pan54_25680 [Rubinisphaera italica]